MVMIIPKILSLLSGAILVTGGAYYVAKNMVARKPQDKVSVMTWNVLAGPFTKYNSAYHKAGAGEIEASSQTIARYSMAGKELTSRLTDIVFLQECETRFFEIEWNSASSDIFKEYHILQCQTSPEEPGTAVLVRKTGRARLAADKPICIGGTQETGGKSKIATVVPVTIGSKEIQVVSTHFTWDGATDLRLNHAALIGKGLVDDGSNVILGGDFNCEPGKNLTHLEGHSFLGKMRHVQLPKGSMTGLSGDDFSKQEHIDHLYISKGMSVRSAAALASPKSPYAVSDGWQPAPVQGPSDHVPVVVELRI